MVPVEPRTGGWARIFRVLIGIGLLISLPVAVMADSVALTWQRNTEADLAGYKIHIGSSPRAYTQTIDVGHVTTFRVSGLSPGQTYFLSITAYDIFANESGYSAELRASIPKAPAPSPEPTPEVVAAATPESARAPATLPLAAAPTPPPATQADAGSAESVGGGGTSGAADGGGGSSPGVLASLLDSVRDMFSSDTSSTAFVSPSGSLTGSAASAGGTGGVVSTAARLRAAREREVEAERLHQQGRDLYDQGNVEEAIPWLRRAEAIWASLPLSEEAGVVAHDLGVAYYTAERHGEAVEAYQKALAIYQQVENRELQARALDDLGRAYEGLGDYTRADEEYRASLEIWDGLGKRAEVAAVLARLGGAQAAAGRYASARTSYQRSVALYQGLEDLDKLEKLQAAITQVERLAEQ